MAIAPTALKVLVGLGVGSTVLVGTGVAFRDEIFESLDMFSTSKFDDGLIAFLNDGGDITFKVTNGANDLSSTNLLNFSGTTPLKATVEVAVTVDSTGTTKGTLTEKTNGENNDPGKKVSLQNLNKVNNENKSWEWSCAISFTKDSTTSQTTLDDSQLLRIFKDSDKGLFNALKAGEKKDKKIKFIKKCAHQRGKDKNNNLNKENGSENKKIESNVDVKLVGSGEKLIFESNRLFNYWFPK